MKYVQRVAKIFIYGFLFSYSLFAIFSLPIPFFEEPDQITFILGIFLLIFSLISLTKEK